MDVMEFRRQLLEDKTADKAQNALTEAKKIGISLQDLLEGTLLNDFLGKEITKFSECDERHLPHQRYDFQLNEDFSFQLEVIQLETEAAMPTKTEKMNGNWELMRLDDDEFILKLQDTPRKNSTKTPAFLRVTHEEIEWVDRI